MHELGVHNFSIVLIENYSCNNREELWKRERYYSNIHNKDILLNSNRACTSFIEKQQQNVKCSKIWYVNNREYKKEKLMIQYKNNKQQRKIYVEKNKLRTKIYYQKYYEHNRIVQELPFYKIKCVTSLVLFF